jgi:signal transduction histidine kinase
VSQKKNSLWKVGRQSTMRQWRSTPTYFFLVWRWGTWIFALIALLTLPRPLRPHVASTLSICLVITFLYTLMVTLYAPVSRVLLTRLSHRQGKAVAQASKSLGRGRRRSKRDRPQLPGTKEEVRILRPLLDTRNMYLNVAIDGLDVVVCGLITYFSAVNQGTPFGAASPFYRYGLSTVLVAGFTYGYRGGLLAAFGYSLFIIFGAFVYPPGQSIYYDPAGRLFDLSSSLIDAPLVALLAAYVARQLNKAIQSKHREQDNARRQRALRGVSETLVLGISDQIQLLRNSVKAIRQGGHFDKLVIALVKHDKGEEPRPDFDTYAETDISSVQHPDVSEELVTLVTKTGRRHTSFDPLSETRQGSRYGVARLYQPFFKEHQLYLVIGAESTRYTPFEARQEEFLAIVGPQLVVALENIRLTQETAALAAIAERSRLARDIHDGVAQLLYMLSLNSETCLAQVECVAETAEDGDRALAPVSRNLEKLVTISKQALWEMRHYMFMLRPMLGGDSTLTQMLTSQLREFETISGLSVRLEVDGVEEDLNGNQQGNRRRDQVGIAIFRITQEALTNAYKHAQASQLEVCLRHRSECITVEINDNGQGLVIPSDTSDSGRIYSGRGLQGMRERASELGGSLNIVANATGGTRIVASIPL